MTVSLINPIDPVLADQTAGYHYNFATTEAGLATVEAGLPRRGSHDLRDGEREQFVHLHCRHLRHADGVWRGSSTRTGCIRDYSTYGDGQVDGDHHRRQLRGGGGLDNDGNVD